MARGAALRSSHLDYCSGRFSKVIQIARQPLRRCQWCKCCSARAEVRPPVLCPQGGRHRFTLGGYRHSCGLLRIAQHGSSCVVPNGQQLPLDVSVHLHCLLQLLATDWYQLLVYDYAGSLKLSRGKVSALALTF